MSESLRDAKITKAPEILRSQGPCRFFPRGATLGSSGYSASFFSDDRATMTTPAPDAARGRERPAIPETSSTRCPRWKFHLRSPRMLHWFGPQKRRRRPVPTFHLLYDRLQS